MNNTNNSLNLLVGFNRKSDFSSDIGIGLLDTTASDNRLAYVVWAEERSFGISIASQWSGIMKQ